MISFNVASSTSAIILIHSAVFIRVKHAQLGEPHPDVLKHPIVFINNYGLHPQVAKMPSSQKVQKTHFMWTQKF